MARPNPAVAAMAEEYIDITSPSIAKGRQPDLEPATPGRPTSRYMTSRFFENDHLNGEFRRAAEELDGELVDQSESEDQWKWFEFAGLTSEQVRDVTTKMIGKRKTTRKINIIGPGEVRVAPR